MSNKRLRLLSIVTALSACLALVTLQLLSLCPVRVKLFPETIQISQHVELVANDVPATETESDSEGIELMLGIRSGLFGFQKKKGILNPRQWRPEYERRRERETIKWLQRAYYRDSGGQPPWQYPGCLVHVNHHYKFIWIKGKKVGGTTIREPLGWICEDSWKMPAHADRTFCSEKLHLNTEMTLEKAKKYWNDYFVFAFVRNPYSRFASSYTYIDSLSSVNVTFEDTCKEPFIHAKIASVTGSNKHHLTQHHIHHMMEQSSCFFTEQDELAVDFVGETENLFVDLGTILDTINLRRPPHLPKLTLEQDDLPRHNANEKKSYAVKLYREHPECFSLVAKHFQRDFDKLDYPQIIPEAETHDIFTSL